jgi:hypothetical protein
MGLQDCANTPIGNWHLRIQWWWKETCEYCFGDSDSPSYAVFGWTHKWSWQVCLDSRVSIISFLAAISFFASHPYNFSAILVPNVWGIHCQAFITAQDPKKHFCKSKAP